MSSQKKTPKLVVLQNKKLGDNTTKVQNFSFYFPYLLEAFIYAKRILHTIVLNWQNIGFTTCEKEGLKKEFSGGCDIDSSWLIKPNKLV